MRGFSNYYAILNIGIFSLPQEIKSAFKIQAIKWHPDKNPELNTTLRMQEINKAYLLLQDPDAWSKYNEEYLRYKTFQQNVNKQPNHEYYNHYKSEERNFTKESFQSHDYEVICEILKRWMANAKRQSISLARLTLEDMVGMSKAGAVAMANGALHGLGRYVVFSIIILIVSAITKSCN